MPALLNRARAASWSCAALTAGVLASGAVPAVASTSPRATDPASCPDAHAAPSSVAPAAYGEAIRCIVSAERVAAGDPPLRTVRALRIAALRHTTDMVALRYFQHVGPSGDSLASRVRATGYTHVPTWRLGEVLAWGTGERATPAGVVAAWMASAPHHAVLMDRRLRDIGVGLEPQVALSGVAGATVTADLGRR